jgi:hypothetical protein
VALSVHSSRIQKRAAAAGSIISDRHQGAERLKPGNQVKDDEG